MNHTASIVEVAAPPARQKTRFSMLPDAARDLLLGDGKIGLAPLLMAIYRATYAGQITCHLSHRELAEDSGLQPRSVRRQLLELQAMWLISVEPGAGYRKSSTSIGGVTALQRACEPRSTARVKRAPPRVSPARQRALLSIGVEIIETTTTKSDARATSTRKIAAPVVAAPVEIDDQVAQRLQALQIVLTPAEASEVSGWLPDQLRDALAICSFRKLTTNPAKYFLDAGRGRWAVPPGARPSVPKASPPAAADPDRQLRDRLAHLWQLPAGLDDIELAGKLREAFARAVMSQVERVASYGPGGLPRRALERIEAQFTQLIPVAMKAIEEDQDLMGKIRGYGLVVLNAEACHA